MIPIPTKIINNTSIISGRMMAICIKTAMCVFMALHLINNFNEYLSLGYYMNQNQVASEKVFKSHAVNHNEPISKYTG